jgi:hypothetical protein
MLPTHDFLCLLPTGLLSQGQGEHAPKLVLSPSWVIPLMILAAIFNPEDVKFGLRDPDLDLGSGIHHG